MNILPKITNYLNTGLLGLLGGAKVLIPTAIIGTILGGVWAIKNAWNKTDEATQQYMDKIRIVNGISLSEHASQTDKYLQIVHDKQKSANEKLTEYIRLRREELGLVKSGSDTQSGLKFGEQFKKEVDDYTFQRAGL